MSLQRRLLAIPLRLLSLFQRRQLERDLEDEFQFHLELRMAQEIAAGQTPESARHIARRSMAGLEQQKERCRDTRNVNVIDDLSRNLLCAIRALKRSPGFATVTIITLALGIGANTAIFSLVDAVMLKLLPVKAPEQLYLIGSDPEHVSVNWNYPDYRAMRDQNTVFTGLAGYSVGLEPIGVQIGSVSSSTAQLCFGIFVSGNYFDVLGISPAIGQAFTAADDRAPGASPYVVLSYSYWQSHFNSDTQAIGRKLLLNGYPFTIIGVSPKGFIGADVASRPDVFIPLMMRSEVEHVTFASWNTRHHTWMAAIGRLKPNTNIKQAEGELFAICKDQDEAERRSLSNPAWANTADPIILVPAARGYSYLAREIKKPLLILFVIVALVLLIACANVANLTLARGASRQREIAVRLAVGASRWRVISQLFTESLLIAVLGGVSGLFVAFLGIRILLRFMPHEQYAATMLSATLDWRTLAFAFTACVVTGLVFGITPAWQSTQPDLFPALKEDLPSSTGSRFHLKEALVVLQVSLSLPLLVGSGLFVRTLGNLREVDKGFSPDHVFIAAVDPTTFGYKGQRTQDFYNQLCDQVGGLPGVQSASLGMFTPLTGSNWDGTAKIEGYTWKPSIDRFYLNAVGPRYFETLGTPLVLGRDFTQFDNPPTAMQIPEPYIVGQTLPDQPGRHVAIVNETFARHFFSDHIALGKHVALSGFSPRDRSLEIVGVAKDARYSTLRNAADPMIFMLVWRRPAGQTDLLIRTAGPTPQLATQLRDQIHKLDPVIPLLNLRTLEQDVDQSIITERLVATLSGFFGALALLLSTVGLYGVVAYTVTRRTREIGIRIAIGARRSSILWLVFKDVGIMIFIGSVIGGVVSYTATRAIGSILFGVSATDPVTLMAAGLCLVAVAVVASFLPARRAAKIDPNIALRYE